MKVPQIMDADVFHASFFCAFMEFFSQRATRDGDDTLFARVD